MLETFAGYLLVVGGRAVSMPPPGALAETAPKRTSRAREGDSFFILVTPTAEARAPAAFFEELARMGADLYFGSSGGITGGLREALMAINQYLLDQQQQVNALALALRGSELYAARSGRMFGALVQEADLVLIPSDRQDPLALNLLPLGSGPEPNIQFVRYTVAPGQMLLLSDAGLLDASDESLRAALSVEGVRSALEQLKTLAGSQASAMVIQFVTPGTPDPDHLATQAGTRAPRSTSLRPSRPPTLPEAIPAEPPVQPQDTALPVETAPIRPPGRVIPSKPAVNREQPDIPGRAHPAPGKPTTAQAASPPRGPSAPTRAVLTIQQTARGVLRSILAGLLSVTRLLLNGLSHIFPTPEEGKQGIPTNLAAGMAILIPLVIVIVVVGLSLSKQGRTEFEVYLSRAKQAHQEALRLSGDQGCSSPDLRPTWAEVLRLANQAAKFREDDLEVLQIRADAQNYLDCFDKVERRDLILLHEFPKGAELVGPISHDGVDLYTLNRKTSAVYHDTLNERGDGLTTHGDEPIFEQGSSVSGYVVGDVFDIEWLNSGGTLHDNVLIALDQNGVLISYSPTFFSTAQQLVTEGRWQHPIAIAVFEINLYVLDIGANQIWKYVPSLSERSYNSAPEEYFNGDERPNLSDAVDFGISADEGAVYILFRDGSIHKYRRTIQGVVAEQPFTYNQLPPGAISSGSALFVDSDPASRNLYIIDAQSETIYETSWGGTFQRGIRPRDQINAFRNLSGIYADAVARNNMYVVAGNKLYYFRRNE